MSWLIAFSRRLAGSRRAHLWYGDTTVSTSLSVRFIVRSTLLSAIAVAALAACMDAPNAPVTAERLRGMAPALAKANAWGPYMAVFDDDTVNNKLRGDGRGTYIDSELACVNSETSGGGLYQLRSIRNTGACKALHRGEWRFFRFDSSATNLDLDQDNSLDEATEDAPARLLASNAFAQGAASTPVVIFILQVLPGDSTSQNHKWQIRYRANVGVSGSGVAGNPRIIQAVLGNAKADIYDVNGIVVASNVDLPFRLSLTKQ
jgi:hypothetical protein